MSTSDNTTTSVLEVRDLHVEVANSDANAEPIQILKGVDLTVRSGETHAIMGPNGSGKSTLSYAIAGHPKYQVTSGSITLNGEDVLAMSVDERARAGLFLAMQYPVEVPGVSMSNFLRTAATAVRGEAPKLRHWVKEVKEALSELEIDPSFIERSVNEGFSGGEKKRHEILQLGMLKPKIAILDDRCIGCSRCAVVCPTECIAMVANEREVEVKGKTIVRKKKPEVRLFACIRCGLCEEYCPTDPKAIYLTTEFAGAGTDKEVKVT